ncbi:MAG: Eco57I restriction-modification methylase domain-containing protein, partial [Bacteroidetes bacterium]|nr:Eco57I restriction-modification methylase domain-containing protein [Bacteroidota bacterium]
LDQEVEEIKHNPIYDHAFEWRIEFPEVLNDDGDFVGFDIVIGNPPYIRQEEFSNIKGYLESNYETFAGTADLYVYFVERGLQLLKNRGKFIFILPNKWMRAGYGKKLRIWINQFEMNFIIDFGDLPVFEEATTYPCLWSINKLPPVTNRFISATVETLDLPDGLKKYIDNNKFDIEQNLLEEGGWSLTSGKVQQLLKKIKGKGVPLSEFKEVKILRGVLTGLNEAFVIDSGIKDKLIAEDPKSIELIKPFLIGRDIKRYQYTSRNRWLILIPKGFTIKRNLPLNRNSDILNEPPPRYGDMPYDDAWFWFRNNYPAIANHLLPFRNKAETRTDKGDFWWELRACDYYIEFEKEKIMLPDISSQCEALFDERNFYCANTAYIIVGLNKYHLGILNSKVVLFFYAKLTQSIRGGYYRFIRQYLEQIPIPEVSDIEKVTLTGYVELLLKEKRWDPDFGSKGIENQINELVYKLYDMTEEEIKMIEG